MNRRVLQAVALIMLLALSATSGFAQQSDVPTAPPQDQERDKRGQTGMKFMSVSVDPRAAAIGDAVTSLRDLGAASMFHNPAGLAYMQSQGGLALGQAQWLGGITHNQAGLAYQPAQGQYGTFGLRFRSVDYGEIERTRRVENTEEGYESMDTFEPSALAVGLSYGRALSNRFAVGGNVSFVRQSFGEGSVGLNDDGAVESESFNASTAAFDFGIMYQPGFRSLNFAMSANNFSPAVEVIREGFELPLTLSIGVSMDMMDFAGDGMSDMHSLLLSVDTAHPRDFDETLDIGGEYQFMDLLSLRAGYTFPSDVQGLNLGAGINYGFGGNISVGADYAYTQFDLFENVHRIGVNVGF